MPKYRIGLCVVLSFFLGYGNTYAEEPAGAVVVEEDHGPANPYRDSGTPINIQQAQIMAGKVRDSQVSQGELARSWSSVKVADTRQRIFQNEKEWVVIFSNPAEVKPAHKNLYIFLDLYGDVVDVNFTGK